MRLVWTTSHFQPRRCACGCKDPRLWISELLIPMIAVCSKALALVGRRVYSFHISVFRMFRCIRSSTRMSGRGKYPSQVFWLTRLSSGDKKTIYGISTPPQTTNTTTNASPTDNKWQPTCQRNENSLTLIPSWLPGRREMTEKGADPPLQRPCHTTQWVCLWVYAHV